MGTSLTWVAPYRPVWSEAVTTSPVTETAIGHSGYCLPFSQAKTISEQLPTGPELINPRSAAGTDLMLMTQVTNSAALRVLKNMLMIAAPKIPLTIQKESKKRL